MTHVTFVGYGKIGAAIGQVIQPHAQIRTFDKDPLKLPAGSPTTLEEAVRGAEVIFLCVPSWVVREVAMQMKPLVSHECVIVALAKGLEEGTLKTMCDVLEEVFPEGQAVGVMGGPMLAAELQQGLPGVAALGMKQVSAHDKIRALFEGSNVRLEVFDDARTVAYASVFKNIYAVGLGIAEGLGWGWNAKGWLCAKALQEMNSMTQMMGGDGAIMARSAGAGDFLATSMSPDSHNRETGRNIAQTGECLKPSEGCRAITSVLTLLGAKAEAFPFLHALHLIINKHEHPKTIFYNLLSSTDDS